MERMLRRLVSLLLLPCLLLTQSATLVHGHGVGTPVGHSSRPHVHANLIAFSGDSQEHSHGHQHLHRHQDTRIHHDSLSSCALDGDASSELALSPVSDADHDTDAIYVSTLDVVSASKLAADETASKLVLTTLFVVAPRVVVAAEAWRLKTPPPVGDSAVHRELYIRHLALLI